VEALGQEESSFSLTASMDDSARVGGFGGGVAVGNAEGSAIVFALEAIVDRLQELKNENEGLVIQLEESNRDLMELQFRVDSHSESFRPMRNSLELPASHLLLPPKEH
jgi:hypothetical protein